MLIGLRQIIIWCKSRIGFLLVLAIGLAVCLVVAYYFKTGWVSLYVPIAIGVVFQRCFEDLNDVRECERQIDEAVDYLKTVTKSSKYILVERYLAVKDWGSTCLYMDIQNKLDYKLVLDSFSKAVKKLNSTFCASFK